MPRSEEEIKKAMADQLKRYRRPHQFLSSPKADKRDLKRTANKEIRKVSPAQKAQGNIEKFQQVRRLKAEREEATRTGTSKRGVPNPVRIRKKAAQRQADLKQTRIKLRPLPDMLPGNKKIISNYTFEATRGKQGVKGSLYYSPRQKVIGVEYIKPKSELPGDVEEIHKRVRGKVMDRPFFKGALEELKRRFPQAESIGGGRITGRKSQTTAFGHQEFKMPKSEQGAKTNTDRMGRFTKAAKRVGRVGGRIGKGLGAMALPLQFMEFYEGMKTLEKEKKRREKARWET